MQQIKFSKRSKLFKKYKLILTAVALMVVIAVVVVLLSSSVSVLRQVFPGLSSLHSTDGSVNILLLGIAGENHDGPYLTDTLMVASINLKTNKIDFISIPRDFWVDKLKSKVNAVYEIGQSKGAGLKLDEATLSDILGIPIHYGFRIDFSGFEKAIDQINGIDIDVEKAFDDYNYPISGKEDDLCGFTEEERDFNEGEAKKLNITPGKQKVLIAPDGKIATDSAQPEKGLEYFKCRYEHISFEKGPQHMDGGLALKFVRSRMGTNGEGSDFARSRRQQKVIDAARKKVLSVETVVNPKRVSDLISTFGKSIDTDIPIEAIVELYDLSKKAQTEGNFVLDDSKGLLTHPLASDFGGAYVLVPTSGDYNFIHEYVKKILSGEAQKNEASSSARSGN